MWQADFTPTKTGPRVQCIDILTKQRSVRKAIIATARIEDPDERPVCVVARQFLAIFNFPWIIKPIYGVLSDLVPLFGYRRKSYLIAANLVAAAAYLWSTQLTAPGQLVWALQLTAYAMAISSTVCGAVLVENGQRLSESGRFVNQQWLWFNAAAMAS